MVVRKLLEALFSHNQAEIYNTDVVDGYHPIKVKIPRLKAAPAKAKFLDKGQPEGYNFYIASRKPG